MKRGGFKTLTGFWIEGVMGRNDVINYPVQGSAFHCLLWSLIRLQRELRWGKMRALIVGQIHDSIVADVPADELDDFLPLAKRIMTEEIRKHWKWIIVPLDIEAEVSESNWFEKKAVEI
jgi:DNA polymerase I